jgi:hypothetical protein
VRARFVDKAKYLLTGTADDAVNGGVAAMNGWNKGSSTH